MTFLTTGKIAERLNVDRDKVSYALRKLGIRPAGVAGPARIFPDSALVAVKTFLNTKVKKQKM